jgi:hypothetical protein
MGRVTLARTKGIIPVIFLSNVCSIKRILQAKTQFGAQFAQVLIEFAVWR